MKTKDNTIKELNIEDLKTRLSKEQEILRTLHFTHAVSPIENPNKIRYTRRMIARIHTLIKQKEQNI